MLFVDVDTAVTVPVNMLALTDDTDFKSQETSVAYNASGMALKWNFQTTAGVTSQTAVTPTSGGDYDWTHLGGAMYKIEIPASGGASINNDTEGVGYFSGICTGVLSWRGPDICFRASGINDKLIDSTYDTNRGLAGLALPAAAAEASGGLYTRGSGAGQINQQANGQVDVNLARWLNTAPLALSSQQVQAIVPDTQKVDVNTIKTNPVANAGTVTFPTNATLASTTNITAGTITTVSGNVNGNVSGTVASVVGAVGSVTGNVGGNVNGSVGSVAGNVVGSVGSVAGNVSGNVNGSVGSVAAGGITASSIAANAFTAAKFASDYYTAVQALIIDDATPFHGADIATILSDVVAISGRLPAALIGGRIDATVGAMQNGVITAASIASNALAAAKFAADYYAAVNAEVVDALATDTYAEPSGVPTATATIAAKLGRLYQVLIEGLVVDSNTNELQFKNAAGTVLWKKAFTDVGGVYTEGSKQAS